MPMLREPLNICPDLTRVYCLFTDVIIISPTYNQSVDWQPGPEFAQHSSKHQ